MFYIKDCYFIIISLFVAIYSVYRLILLRKEISAQKEFFINTLGHDIRVPLIAQIRGLELLAENTKRNSDNILISNELYNSSKYTLEMITMLMDIYKIENDEYNFLCDNCRITDIYSAISNQYRLTINCKDTNTASKAENILISANRTYLLKALKMLIETAMLYSDNNTDIYFDTIFQGENVVFNISYTGNFITEEEYNRMFSKNTVYSVVGQGIQMYFCKKIIDLHKGKIYLNSNKNRLNSFKVKIPLSTNQPMSILSKFRFIGHLDKFQEKCNSVFG